MHSLILLLNFIVFVVDESSASIAAFNVPYSTSPIEAARGAPYPLYVLPLYVAVASNMFPPIFLLTALFLLVAPTNPPFKSTSEA